MGTVVDTTVFIDLELTSRKQSSINPSLVIGDRLLQCLGPDEEAAISAITASELLHGLHRANAANRPRREAFVEMILSVMPILDFDRLAARAHARLWSDLVKAGRDTRPHDRIVAATAISIGWRVATANARHFDAIPGLEVIIVR